MSPDESLPAPYTLVFEATNKLAAYACRECGLIISPTTFGGGPNAVEFAESFAREHCHKKCDCGAPLEKYRSRCSICWSKDQDERQQKKYELATKVLEGDYSGPVYWENHAGSMGDGYFSGVDEIRDYCEEEVIDLPLYVWSCTEVPLELDVDRVLETAFDGHYEGARDMLQAGAEKELDTLLRAWCEKQDIKSWEQNLTEAVILEPHEQPQVSEESGAA